MIGTTTIISLPTPGAAFTGIGTWSLPVADQLFLVVLFAVGIAVGVMAVKFVGRKLAGAGKGVLGGRKGGKRRRR